ncbi:uncharacterized protein LOC126837504 [Adelges cooleyi]|uniref:uncharacterized protein LOC126837504 n=1 Tax=Adelges cooleyi TaxID=133065 RepID=UPI00217F74AD|nr:uncharacterized protein LOC126837504 [Adelges cooleyi]XP_050427379.1 uncharacterized protein LOC126837504 [Adelges cooleyi]
MRILCILIPFAMVNVMVAVLDDFARQVIITNKLIERADAAARMPEIIRNIIVEGSYTMEKMALMISSPETRDSHGNLNIYRQLDMRGEIRALLALRTPEIVEAEYENVTLQDLGNARRRITLEAVKTLIRDVIRIDNDPNNRNNPNIQLFGRRNLCRLLGLFRSALRPSTFAVNANMRLGTCTIVFRNGVDIRYRYIEDKIWEIKCNGLLLQPLSDQIQ